MTLTNAGTFLGSIRNEIGTLKLSSSANIQNQFVDVASGLLDVNGFSPTISVVSGPGNISSSVGGAVMLNLSGSFDGIISDGSGVVSVTPGVQLVLNGNNTYSGNTIITNFWQLYLGPNATLGSGSFILSSGNVFVTASRAIPIANPVYVTGDAYVQGYGGGLMDMEFSSDTIVGLSGEAYVYQRRFAQAQCAESRPEFREVKPGHFVACHLVS